jgi:hypothetical protein
MEPLVKCREFIVLIAPRYATHGVRIVALARPAVRSGPINENSVVAMTALMEISAVKDQNRPFSRTESFSHQRSEEGFGDQQRSAVIAKA